MSDYFLPLSETQLPLIISILPILHLLYLSNVLLLTAIIHPLNKNTMAKTTSYAEKPRLIGAVIMQLMAEKQLDKKIIAKQMGVTLRTFERWYKRAYLTMPQMLKLSPLLNYNLLADYHPNMKPAPNLLQEPLNEAKAELALMERKMKNYEQLKTEKQQLEAEKEVLLLAIAAMNGKKG